MVCDPKKNPKVVVIVPARLSSRRLPGKLLLDIVGKPVLQHVIERAQRANLVHQVMVATTTDESDEPIVSLGKQLGVPVFRGSQEDVLERFYGAATSADADIIIRITGDCPLIDPHLIDEVVQTLLAEDVDFVSVNSIVRDFPRGVDTEGLTIDALARAEREATGSHHREHVTLYLIANLDRFKYIPIRAEGPLQRSDLRMCIDEEADLLLARAIFDHFAVIKPHFSTLDVVNLLDGNPEIRALNEHVRQPNPPDAVLPVHLLPQETES